VSHREALKAYRAEDYMRAKELWEQESQKENDQAMVNIGLLYLKGEGVTKDFHLAKEWFERSLIKENASGYYNLALMYQSHIGVDEDLPKALEYFRKAHQLGHANASFRLAVWLLKDRVDAESMKEGFDAMLSASRNNHAMAKMQLGGLEQKADLTSPLNLSFREKSHEEQVAIIEDALDRYIRPILIKDGGNIMMVNFIEKPNIELHLVYQGNCAGCSMASTGTYSIIYDTLSRVIDKQILVYVL
jgi:TPR repeat protein